MQRMKGILKNKYIIIERMQRMKGILKNKYIIIERMQRMKGIQIERNTNNNVEER
jgi:hypothetical protein